MLDFDESLFDDDIDFDISYLTQTPRKLNDVGETKSIETSVSSESTFKAFIADQKAKSTVYKDTSDIRTLTTFFRKYGETRDLASIPSTQLDSLLAEFFMSAKKKNGGNYEPDTLNSIRNSLQRHLCDHGSKLDLKTGVDFSLSRNVLSAKRKELTKLGLGQKANATRALTNEEVDFLYEKKYFGIGDPETLQRTMWWVISLCFGYRAREEVRKLKWGDVKLPDKINGAEFLLWDIERGTKTRTGEQVQGHQRAFDPKAFATGGQRCPVMIYKLYKSHRPLNALRDNSPFFLSLRRERSLNISTTQVWYLDSPLGKNEIGKFMSKARSILPKCISGMKGKVANHSVRKTAITKLLDGNAEPIIVQQLSGHKRTESLLSYYKASESKQRQMSDILTGESSIVSSQTSVEFNRSKGHHDNSQNPIFSGASFTNCTFNLGFQPPPSSTDVPNEHLPLKRIQRIYDSDDESAD